MSGVIDLRQAGPTDAAAIRDLTRAAYAKWVPLIGREPWPMTANYEGAVHKHRFDLLYLDNVLAALVETVDQGDQLLIQNVAVSPSFQKRGLGSRLMAHAERIASTRSYRRVSLYTNKHFAENVRFYRKLGYSVDREEDVGGGVVLIHMSKTLA